MTWEQRFEIIGQKIREVLAAEGVRDTDKAVANFLQTSLSTYRRWKSGYSMPDAESLAVMAKKLNLSCDWMLLGVGCPELRPGLAPSASAPVAEEAERIQDLERELAALNLEYTAVMKELLSVQRDNMRLLRVWVHVLHARQRGKNNAGEQPPEPPAGGAES